MGRIGYDYLIIRSSRCAHDQAGVASRGQLEKAVTVRVVKRTHCALCNKGAEQPMSNCSGLKG